MLDIRFVSAALATGFEPGPKAMDAGHDTGLELSFLRISLPNSGMARRCSRRKALLDVDFASLRLLPLAADVGPGPCHSTICADSGVACV